MHMNTSRFASSEPAPGVRANTINLALWTGAWLVTMAGAAFGPRFLWESALLTLLAILINFAVGIGMIWANVRHLKGLDELMRKIQLEAMAFTLGIAVVAGLSFSLLDTMDLIPFEADIGFLVLLIGLTYIVATVIGARRYR